MFMLLKLQSLGTKKAGKGKKWGLNGDWAHFTGLSY
jgi:hypothetical protein